MKPRLRLTLLLGAATLAAPAVPAAAQEPPPTVPAPSLPTPTVPDCHPAYEICLPNQPGDTLDCDDVLPSSRPFRVKDPAVDPYNLDADGDGLACVPTPASTATTAPANSTTSTTQAQRPAPARPLRVTPRYTG